MTPETDGVTSTDASPKEPDSTERPDDVQNIENKTDLPSIEESGEDGQSNDITSRQLTMNETSTQEVDKRKSVSDTNMTDNNDDNTHNSPTPVKREMKNVSQGNEMKSTQLTTDEASTQEVDKTKSISYTNMADDNDDNTHNSPTPVKREMTNVSQGYEMKPGVKETSMTSRQLTMDDKASTQEVDKTKSIF